VTRKRAQTNEQNIPLGAAMDYTLIEAKYIRPFTIWVRFDDGVEGEIDFRPELYGLVFEPLLDPAQFRKFSIHPEFHTLVWENGADIAPEFLQKKAQQSGTSTTPRP
jgi:hypothetical protein